MLRIIIFELLLFLAPFALYALYVVISRKVTGSAHRSQNILFWLALTGLLMMAVGFFMFVEVKGDKPGGKYRPAEIIDGKIRPGHVEDGGK